MLGKLIKYDIINESRIFILIHVIMLTASILGRFFFLGKLDFHGDQQALIASLTLFISFYILLFTSLCFAIMLLMTVRFYKNLFSAEGYLTWTLPATPTQQLWGKILSGTILYILDILLCAIGILILTTSPNVTSAYAEIAPEINEIMGMSVSSYAFYIFIFVLCCSLSSVIMMYFCIVVGQLFPAHRLLCAVISYVIVSFILQILTFTIMFGLNLYPVTIDYAQYTSGSMLQNLITIFKFTGILILITTIIEYLGMHYIMNKKINLQ